jgi:hypothetical protein
MNTFTIEISGRKLPVTGHVRILTGNDQKPAYFSELTGPEKAFDLREGGYFDRVKVIRPELVEIKTLQVM